MIAVIDYGVGNLFSLTASLKALSLDSVVTREPSVLHEADQLILPGVGAFGDAMRKLEETGLVPVIREEASAGKPILGICLGMQLLFDKSYEYGEHDGLSLIGGSVKSLRDAVPNHLKIPQMGWNRLIPVRDEPLLRYCSDAPYAYFVHSYYATACEEALSAYAEYHVRVPGIVRKDNVWGTQFHPEKSGADGLSMLRAFSEVTA